MIERADDAGDFETIGTVASKGREGYYYDFIDDEVGSGVYFYRLVDVDKNGIENRSEVVRAALELTIRQDLHVYPNPVKRDRTW